MQVHEIGTSIVCLPPPSPPLCAVAGWRKQVRKGGLLEGGAPKLSWKVSYEGGEGSKDLDLLCSVTRLGWQLFGSLWTRLSELQFQGLPGSRFLILVHFFFSFYCHTCGIWKFPGQGSNWSGSRQPTPQPQQRGL